MSRVDSIEFRYAGRLRRLQSFSPRTLSSELAECERCAQQSSLLHKGRVLVKETSGRYKITDKRPMDGIAIPESLVASRHAYEFKGLEVSVAFPEQHLIPSNPEHDAHKAWLPEIPLTGAAELEAHWAPQYMVVSVVGGPSSIPKDFVASEEWRQAPPPGRPDPFASSNIRGIFVDILDDAFEYWLRVIRWRTNSAVVGRDSRARASTYPPLIDEVTGAQVTGSGFTLSFFQPSFLNAHTWATISLLLEQGKEPPLALEYFFDGLHQLGLGDLRRAVMDLAIAVELHMKHEVARSLPRGLNPEIRSEVTKLSASKYRESIFSTHLPEDLRPDYSSIKPTLRSLAEARNKIMHGGESSVLAREAHEFVRAVEELLTIEATPINPNTGSGSVGP